MNVIVISTFVFSHTNINAVPFKFSIIIHDIILTQFIFFKRRSCLLQIVTDDFRKCHHFFFEIVITIKSEIITI